MTERKHKTYTLWLKWRHQDWRPVFNVTYLGGYWGPSKVIAEWMASHLPSWKRTKHWRILPAGRKPR